jgi:hypothetical protein
MNTEVVSEEAEAACRLLNETLANHRVVIRALHQMHRRSRLTAVLDREQLQRHSTLVRLLTITESFAVERLTQFVEPWANGGTLHVREYWSAAVNSETNSWNGIRDSYKRWVGPATKAPEWGHPLGYAEARNAVAHGLGKLTRRQTATSRKRNATVAALANVEIVPTDDNDIKIDEETLNKAVTQLCKFIESLDRTVPEA